MHVRAQASDVAVKTFDNVSAENRQDLHREALAMVELRHPHIAQIFGACLPTACLALACRQCWAVGMGQYITSFCT